MSILIYIEHIGGNIKKNALEAASYGVAYAEKTGLSARGVVIGKVADDEIKKVETVGLEKVIKVDGHDYLNHQKISAILSDLAKDENANTIIFSGSSEGKASGSRLAIKINAGIITEVIMLPSSNSPVTLKKKSLFWKRIC